MVRLGFVLESEHNHASQKGAKQTENQLQKKNRIKYRALCQLSRVRGAERGGKADQGVCNQEFFTAEAQRREG